MPFFRVAQAVLLGGVAALTLAPPRALGYQRAVVEGKPGIWLYWPSRTVEFWISKEGYSKLPLSETTGAILRSFHAWSSPSCSDFVFNYRGLIEPAETNATRSVNSNPDGINLVRWREDEWPPRGIDDTDVSAAWLALTVLVYDAATGVLLDADIELNGVQFAWSTTDDPSQILTDVQNVVTHEVGHVVGLDHSDVETATMYLEQTPRETHKRILDPDDIRGLCESYPFGMPTPLGPDQRAPLMELVGGCTLSPKRVGEGAPPWLALSLVWLRLLIGRGGHGPRPWGARRRRRGR